MIFSYFLQVFAKQITKAKLKQIQLFQTQLTQCSVVKACTGHVKVYAVKV